MTEFAKGGIIPGRPGSDDDIPAILSPGRVILLGKPSLLATTPEGAALLAKLNGPTPAFADSDDEPWVCTRCQRGQCARCRDDDCSCCSGNPQDLLRLPGG